MDRKDIRIFIASSGELQNERKEFDSVLVKLNKTFSHLHLEPVNFMYDTSPGNYRGKERIQDEINPLLSESDIVVVLFYSKIGIFTKEEFENSLNENKKVFLYFKEGFQSDDPDELEKYLELTRFKKKIEAESSMRYVSYKNEDDFSKTLQLDLLNYLKNEYPPKKKVGKPDRSSPPLRIPPVNKIIWLHTYIFPKYFVGRDEELKKLNNFIYNKHLGGTHTSIISIIAIGGIGKSCLVRKYVETVKNDKNKFTYIIWFSFASAESEDGAYLFRSILQKINFAQFEKAKNAGKEAKYYYDAVIDLFEQHPILIVLDSFELIQDTTDRKSIKFGKIKPQYDLICQFLLFISNDEKSKVILTSRTGVLNFEDNAYCEEINLNTLRQEDGATLLKNIGVVAADKDLQKLSNLLGNHALCLKAAGNIITKKMIEPNDFKNFIGPSVFNSTEEGEKIVEILNLYKDLLTPDQQHFLIMMSLHARDVSEENFPVLLIDSNKNHLKKMEIYDQIIYPLLNLGLIEAHIINNKHHFDIHPLMKFAYTTWWSTDPSHKAYETLALAAKAEGMKLTKNIDKIENLQVYFDIIFYYIKANKVDLAFRELENNYLFLMKYRQSEKVYEFLKEIESSNEIKKTTDKIYLMIRIAETTENLTEELSNRKKALLLAKNDGFIESGISPFYCRSLMNNGMLDEAEKTIKDYDLMDNHEVLGILNIYKGKFKIAKEYLLNHYINSYGHDKRRSAQWLGPVLIYLKELDEADTVLSEQLKVAIANDDACCILPLYRYNIDLAIEKNAFSLADELYEQMKTYCKEKGIKELKTYSYSFYKERYDEIRTNLDIELTEDIENHNVTGQILGSLLLAKYFKLTNNVTAAKIKFESATALIKKTGIYRYNYYYDSIKKLLES